MEEVSPINKVLKILFCDKGKHWNENVMNKYEDCRICGHRHEFTITEQWALKRGLPARPTKFYYFKEDVKNVLGGILGWVIIVFYVLISLLPLVLTIMALIWFMRHW
jgi:hypothetical protein